MADGSSPQFAYKIEVFPGSDTSRNPALTVSKIDPDSTDVLIPYAAGGTPTIRFTLTDAFDHIAKPVEATASVATPSPAVAVVGTVSGLNYGYYEGDLTKIPALS